MRTRLSLIFPGLAVGLLSVYIPVSAQVLPGPTTVNVQGRLTGTSGGALADGPHTITVSLWDSLAGGTQRFSQTLSNVAVKNGVFSAPVVGLTPALVNGDVWVQFQVDGDAAMTPRLALAAVASALKANTVPDGAIGPAQLAADGGALPRVSGGALNTDGTNLVLKPGAMLTFTDNGQIRSLDNNHGLLFRRTENILELREYGRILLTAGATAANPAPTVTLTAAGNVGIGTSTPSTALEVNGEVTAKVITVLGGSDVAEPYNVSGAGGVEPAPGMVVALDATHVGQMRVAATAYDKAVAGIISGANGIAPGITLRQKGTIADGAFPVAGIGRVWCYCDADANGAITVGDMLTTSDTPGHAMKATDRERRDGSVIGKAMSPLASGKGLVLVLVSLK